MARRLIEPAASIVEPERRRQARLLTALLLILLPMSSLALMLLWLGVIPVATASARATLAAELAAEVLLLAVCYGLSRTTHTQLAAGLAVATTLGATFAALLANPQEPLLLAFLTLGGLLSGLFLSPRITAGVFAASLLGLVLLRQTAGISNGKLITALFFTLTAGGLVVIAAIIRQRNLEQIERQARALAEDERRLSAAMHAVQTANASLHASVVELEQRNQDLGLLAELSGLLEASATAEEAYRSFGQVAPRLFPATPGALFVYGAAGHELEAVAHWGEPALPPLSRVFRPEACWAHRRGQTHVVRDMGSGLVCGHVHPPVAAGYVCVPMRAQGDVLGILHLWEGAATGPAAQTSAAGLDQWTARASAVGEQLALALGNVVLRETLRSQAIRDGLTGLFNRRYLEETLERELQRAARKGSPLSVIMLDIDHFKPFNDSYGHVAGDALLRAVGNYLRAGIRGGDMACRYGGEEFIIILPEATQEISRQRAEALRAGIHALRTPYGGQLLEPVTVSLGVATFPEHGSNSAVLINAADSALYQAKRDGRDRVCVSGG
ncbi:MAG: diguanylate cyclase [Anaerolineales bacterium]|nr:diguanylate cyclase [Anaerolineales bacterium]